MRQIRWIAPLVALVVLGGCADWNTGTVSSVIDAHVLRVVSQLVPSDAELGTKRIRPSDLRAGL